jgi:Na+/phosphate symporter
VKVDRGTSVAMRRAVAPRVVFRFERGLRPPNLSRGEVRKGGGAPLRGQIHLDVLTNLKRISSHVTALVLPILEEV